MSFLEELRYYVHGRPWNRCNKKLDFHYQVSEKVLSHSVYVENRVLDIMSSFTLTVRIIIRDKVEDLTWGFEK
jgi:hypothetical protein